MHDTDSVSDGVSGDNTVAGAQIEACVKWEVDFTRRRQAVRVMKTNKEDRAQEAVRALLLSHVMTQAMDIDMITIARKSSDVEDIGTITDYYDTSMSTVGTIKQMAAYVRGSVRFSGFGDDVLKPKLERHVAQGLGHHGQGPEGGSREPQ
ncbi:hypothetical protein CC86DRAFT_411700 [Ophiobolus disseminans]|uniref:Uncharacterized protein n=1 Tax=Ophiobolus disseminans TaxID=1469910 RepID=A0A6A6ZKV6_9PLEO|nr:hypothetical protein CC86DRAFT_411700 [Ophiobolus disseminans]